MYAVLQFWKNQTESVLAALRYMQLNCVKDTPTAYVCSFCATLCSMTNRVNAPLVQFAAKRDVDLLLHHVEHAVEVEHRGFRNAFLEVVAEDFVIA